MIGLSDIKPGKIILLDGAPHKVLSSEHSKIGRMGAVLRTKLKNLATGAMFDKTFQGADKVEEATVVKNTAQYLYRDGNEFVFMDMESFEQFSLDADTVGEAVKYLTEGLEITIGSFEGRPLMLELPVKVKLKVTEAPPNIKGDTSSGGDKVVTVETGAKITVPLFINTGDTIIVNTEKGTYAGKE